MMEMTRTLILLLSLTCCALSAETASKDHSKVENRTQEVTPSARAFKFADFIPCLSNYDVGCFLDNAENLVEAQRKQFLVQVGAEARKLTGRKDSEASSISDTITKLLDELTSMFKDSVTNLFRNGKEADEEEDEKSEVAETGNGTSRGYQVEGRKKKIHKLIDKIKLLVAGAAVIVVLGFLLKLFNTALQLKFLLIALGGLAINAARLWFELKNKHHQKVIYYEHAKHEHHYDHHDDGEYYHSAPGDEHWGRSYQDALKEKAQKMAYGKYTPSYASNIEDKKPDTPWIFG